jgi:hypothetical protein
MFKVVYIPAVTSQPISEWSIDIPPGKDVECLTDRLKTHFASSGPGGTASKDEEQKALLGTHASLPYAKLY